eukprot:UN24664
MLVRDPPEKVKQEYEVATKIGEGFRNPSESHTANVFLFESNWSTLPLLEVLRIYK